MEHSINILKSLVYAFFIFLDIKTGVVKILFILMLIDSALGIIKALRLGKKFSFKILAWGMISKLSVLIIPMIIALMAKGCTLDFHYFVLVVIDIIIVNEGISCITNILSIKIKKQIENTDYISKMLEAIRHAFISIINKGVSTIENTQFNEKNK